ncbi:hypothetical protein [Xanthomonas theicola]|uniref:hypothetical protein n=1 Tax=Xanthomonas theicola TaxID=56464 RepID=UPI001FEA2CDC|nr:hypothetical protein [Xanthomonas theicola]
MENALPRLTHLTEQALSVALEPAAERFGRQLSSAEQTLHRATQDYAQAQHCMQATATRRLWMASIALLVASCMGLCAVAYALHSARDTLAQAAQRRAEIAYLDRVARADLVACGEDRLCGNFEKKGPRYGHQGRYRVIALRQSTPR